MRWITWTATLVVLSILLQAERFEAANILALFPFGSRSHNNVYNAITTALAKKGHHLTVVTPVTIDPPNSNYVQIDTSKDMVHKMKIGNKSKKVSVMELFLNFTNIAMDTCESTLSFPEMKDLIDNRDGKYKFDLIILSAVLTECYYAFADVHKAPMVIISPNSPINNMNGIIGNMALPSFVPNILLSYTDKMSFTERLVNLAFTQTMNWYYELIVEKGMEMVMRDAFGENTRPISDLREHISLFLLNSHFSLNYPQPLVPNCVEVGGVHVKPPKELPQSLKSFLDGAGNEGVIYFSLGSVLQSADLDREVVDEFIKAFSQVKPKILWKWEGKSPIQGESEKFRFEKWLPQQDVLAHPNVKLFITHGGLLSFQEAADRGVPMIGIPYFGDQEINMNKVERWNVGKQLDAHNLTAENILNAINEVLGNPRYAVNMKRIQSIVRDQQNKPLDRAIYWIEYVLRHNGAKHLRSSSASLYWYQLYMLDILFVAVILPFTIISVLLWLALKLILKKCSSKKKPKDSTKKIQ